MSKLTKYILILSVVAISCNSSKQDQLSSIKDFIGKEETSEYYIDKSYTFDEILELYDTIPSKFGYKIFEDIIDSIQPDSSEFKKRWKHEILKINHVCAIKTNKIFDKSKLLSDDTYFLIINFTSFDTYPFSATIYADLRREKLGTYYIEKDTADFYHIEIGGDSLKIHNLKEKLKINNNYE